MNLWHLPYYFMIALTNWKPVWRKPCPTMIWITSVLNSLLLSISSFAPMVFCIPLALVASPPFPLSDVTPLHCSIHYLGLHLNFRTKVKSYMCKHLSKERYFAAHMATCHLTTSVLCGKRVNTYKRELIMIWLYSMASLTAFHRDTWKYVTAILLRSVKI